MSEQTKPFFEDDGFEDQDYLELYLPLYLDKDLNEYKRLVRAGENFSSFWDELYSSINIAYHDGEITEQQAKYLRERYLGI